MATRRRGSRSSLSEGGTNNDSKSSQLPLMDAIDEYPEDISYTGSFESKQKPLLARIYGVLQAMGLTRVFVWIVLTVAYTVLGAWIYRLIEADIDLHEREERYQFEVKQHKLRNESLVQLIKDIKALSHDPSYQRYTNDYERKDKMLDTFKDLISRYDASIGIDTSPPVMAPPGWTFINAMFFCCSLYTSIGFGGRLYPNTSAGRLVTMIYSFIGIPFMLAMTSDLGLVIFDGFYWLWWKSKLVLANWFPEKENKGAQVENIELARKTDRTFPVSYGLLLSLLSLLFCSAMCQTFEPTWTFFMANYYMVTSFLTIGLGDISPSAPNNAPSWTLFAHVFMLVFSMTFIGLSQHALDRRIELSFAYIENSIHMYFRTLQDNPEEAFPDDMPVDQKINKLASKLGFFNRLYYMAMDQSRSRLLIEIWRRKENLRNQSCQARGPKREIGVQHLVNVEPWNDCKSFGDYVPSEYNYRPPEEEQLQEVKYVYQIEE